jgi:hypothetical protein
MVSALNKSLLPIPEALLHVQTGMKLGRVERFQQKKGLRLIRVTHWL